MTRAITLVDVGAYVPCPVHAILVPLDREGRVRGTCAACLQEAEEAIRAIEDGDK